MFQKKPSASEVDGVQYRRAKLWQIICYACNAFVGMSVYSLIGMASYSASIGYGITTATVGLILMLARILDGFTDPMLAFIYDRVNTRFGKLRILLISGYLIEAVGLLCMFNLCSSKGFGLPVFVLTYIIYIIGYTVTNMTAQTLPAIMTNDPRQRPTIGVWTTALNYFVPMGMSMLIYTVILPKCGGTFNQDFLSTVCTIVLIIAGIGTLIVCAGISAYDKPENFEGTSKKHEPLKTADILEVLKHNKPLQCYIASNASDKLAQQVGSQAIINTMLNGILIGNMGLATTLGVISMVPSIFFAAFGAKYVGKNGSKKGIVTWTCVSMAIASVLFLFFMLFQSLLYIIAVTTSRKIEADSTALMYQLQADQYEKMHAYLDETRRIRHDFKHTIAVLNELSQTGQYEKLQEYISNYSSEISNVQAPATYCDNPVVNATIHYYIDIAQSYGIRTKLQVVIPKEIAISDIDLCLIFGNLLDNAVTACRHVRTDARFIRLSADLDTPGHLYITMVNSFDGNVCTRNGKYISTKERKSGIGLASIQATTQKYHGSSNFYTEQHEFISNIMLKLKENETE